MTEPLLDHIGSPSIDPAIVIGNQNGHAAPAFEVRDTVPSFSCSDTGNGMRFKNHEGHDCLYCDAQGIWYLYDGRRWVPDTTLAVEVRAKRVGRRIYDEAEHAPTQEQRATLARWAMRTEEQSRLMAMIRSARSELPVTPDGLDADLYLLNLVNGTYELEGHQFREHRREDRITKLAPVSYDPHATCPLWVAVLERATRNNQEMVSYLQRFFGYCLSGDITERMLLFVWGAGANGKSLVIRTIHAVLGDYARSTQPETIMQRERKEQSNDLAMLMGARFVSTVEVADGSRFAESLIKQLTGGDAVTARRLYQNYVTFTPTFKFCVAGNHKPVVKGTDEAMWERVHVFPFPVVIPVDERDPYLDRKLLAEISGILNWMIDGYRDWRRRGLCPPPAVRIATAEYREEMDVLKQFFEERCVLDAGAWALASDLYHSYTTWALAAGERNPLSQTRFGLSLGQRGFRKDREQRGTRRTLWRGIGLLSPILDRVEQLDTLSSDLSHKKRIEKSIGNDGLTVPPCPTDDAVTTDEELF